MQFPVNVAQVCANCRYYRVIEPEVREQGVCFLRPPILLPGAEPPWVRPNVYWSDTCASIVYNHELERLP